jgi:hypothetical protein
VYSNSRAPCFSHADISAATNLSPEIYAGCASGNTLAAACFAGATVGPGHSLRLTRSPRVWSLVSADGRTHWRAPPSSKFVDPKRVPCVAPTQAGTP